MDYMGWQPGHSDPVNELASFLAMNSRMTTTAARMYDIASLLVKAGIGDVDALVPLKYDDLFSIKGIGPVKARVIQSALMESGKVVDAEYLRFRYSEIDKEINKHNSEIVMRSRTIQQLRLQQTKILEMLESIQTMVDGNSTVVGIKQLSASQIAERNRSNRAAAAVITISDFLDDNCRSIYTTRIAKTLVRAGVVELSALKGMGLDDLLGVDGMYKQHARIVQRAIHASGVQMDRDFLEWERNRLLTENAELSEVVTRAVAKIEANKDSLKGIKAALEEE